MVLFNNVASHRDTLKHDAQNQGKKPDVGLAAFRDLIDQFEHIECRIHQALYSDALAFDREEAVESTWFWLNVLHRFGTHAVFAAFIDGKESTSTVHVTAGPGAGKPVERWEHEPMRSPKRYLNKLRNERKTRSRKAP